MNIIKLGNEKMVLFKKNVDNKKNITWMKPILLLIILGLMLLISGPAIADNGDHMDGGDMMDMGWWGSSYMWFMMIGYWLVFIIIGILVYKDAKNRGMNGLLWFILVIIPWIGILFLIIYLYYKAGQNFTRGPAEKRQCNIGRKICKG